MIFFVIILFVQVFLNEGLNWNLYQFKTTESAEQQQQLDGTLQLQLQNQKNNIFATNQHNRTITIHNGREKRSLGRECPNGLYCDPGYFCGTFHPTSCYPIGNTECSNFDGSCASGYYCGMKYCIPIGHLECPNGNYCSNKTYFCGKLHPEKCFEPGTTECPNFVGNCPPDHYCGKTHCIPIGHMECPNGNHCLNKTYYCSKFHPGNCFVPGDTECPNFVGSCSNDKYCGKKGCIPIGHMECPSGNYCLNKTYYCSKFHPGKCFPNGETECPNFAGSCPNSHYCGRRQCIPIL